MKHKDLYNYIKEQIVEVLSEDTIQYTDDRGEDNIANITPTSPEGVQSIDTLKKNQKIKKVINTTKNVKLKEMANVADIIKIQNPEKFALAKEIYTAGKTGALLSAVEAAGAEGITKTSLGTTLNVRDSELSPIINSLRAAGVLSPKREIGVKSPEEEPELPTLSPDEEPEEVDWEVQKTAPDDFETPEEEETSEEEPTSVSDKEVEKTVGKTYAELSPEEEEIFKKYKTAITNKLKTLADKKSSTDVKKIAQAAIDNYKKNDAVKKIFTKKGLDLINYINSERSELNK
jgi:hypothetical protein